MRLIANTLVLARRPEVFLGRRAYILVLSHMRSYSSLLCHILGSHTDIAGYAEMHVSYRSGLDLLRMRARVFRSLGGDLPGRYVLDKVLHNEYAVPPSIIRRRDVYPIILLRQPAPSIASVIEMGKEIAEVPWYSNVSEVTGYYVNRVRRLAQISAQMDSRYLFVRAEDIVESPSRVLHDVESFLGLRQPLSESYSTFPHTGERGWGDSSPTILVGRIVRDRSRSDRATLEESQVGSAIRAYDSCCRILEARSVRPSPRAS
jgi:hypothetical protein